jgi:hypothetical protein
MEEWVKEWIPIVEGALSGTIFDLLIDFPLSKIGAYYAWQIKDPEGRYIWGIGTGDIIGATIASGLALGGHYLATVGELTGEALKNAGLGWLLALGSIKIGELYLYLKEIMPISPK